jgi:hypothetical protein
VYLHPTGVTPESAIRFNPCPYTANDLESAARAKLAEMQRQPQQDHEQGEFISLTPTMQPPTAPPQPEQPPLLLLPPPPYENLTHSRDQQALDGSAIKAFFQVIVFVVVCQTQL